MVRLNELTKPITVDKYMCSCDPEYIIKNGYGTGYNQTELTAPDWLYEKEVNTISVDSCIAHEIELLWQAKIKTRGSCCGHNVSTGFIQVVKDDIQKMRDLGYRQYYYGGNQHERKDAFLPVTLYSVVK